MSARCQRYSCKFEKYIYIYLQALIASVITKQKENELQPVDDSKIQCIEKKKKMEFVVRNQWKTPTEQHLTM